MKTVPLTNDYKNAAARMRGQHPAPQHATIVMGDEDSVAVSPDGTPQVVLLKQRIPSELYLPAYDQWKTVNETLSNRGSAVGATMLPGKTKAGGRTRRNRVPKEVLDLLPARHGTLGYTAEAKGKPHHTGLTIAHPEMLDDNRKLIELINSLYAQALPRIHARQLGTVQSPWRLWDTGFTTLYLVRELRSAYHSDTGNMRGVMTAIMCMGNFSGAELVLLRWGLAIAYEPGDLLFFNPQNLHGNLPFTGNRLSAALYAHKRLVTT